MKILLMAILLAVSVFGANHVKTDTSCDMKKINDLSEFIRNDKESGAIIFLWATIEDCDRNGITNPKIEAIKKEFSF